MGGSATALLLAKFGYKTVMIEKGEHPRFALGESSTPVMSKKIRQMGKAYDIPEFVELSSYDRIMSSEHPFLCGPKELFHYFLHEPGQTEVRQNGEIPEIIVQTPDIDVQFLRSELDMRVMEYAKKYGADYLDHTEVKDIDFRDDGVTLLLQHEDSEPYEMEAEFVVDASGFRSFLANKFDLRLPEEELDTPLMSRCIFTHMKDVGSLEDAVGDDPEFVNRTKVPRSRATQHHCFDGGWYWFIPFDNNVTSVGLSLDMHKYPMNDLSGEEEFWQITNQFPIVKKMLEGRETLLPYIKTNRLQFRVREAVGDRWALLPAAAIGGDAWFSTGLGITMIAADRLARALHNKMFPNNEFKREHLVPYEEALFKEWWYVTRMIDGIYKSFRHFDVFKSYCFFCFMGAESYVHSKGIWRPDDPDALLLNVGDTEFTKRFEEIYERVKEYSERDHVTEEEAEGLRLYLQNEMKPFNYRDYGNPEYHGIHYRLVKDSPFFDGD